MDFVWGSIDMYIFYRIDIMSQKRRITLLKKLYSADDRTPMRKDLYNSLDATVFDLADEDTKWRAVDVLMTGSMEDNIALKKDNRKYLFNAVTSFITTVATAIPAAVCLAFIPDWSNALLWASIASCTALFFTGYSMSPYDRPAYKALTGLSIAAISMALTLFAAFFGG